MHAYAVWFWVLFPPRGSVTVLALIIQKRTLGNVVCDSLLTRLLTVECLMWLLGAVQQGVVCCTQPQLRMFRVLLQSLSRRISAELSMIYHLDSTETNK